MTYIIAELGSVHDGSLGNALKLIEECHKAGADAVKLQAHNGERIKGDPPWFTGVGEQRGDYLKRTSFNREQWREIRDAATFWTIDLVVSPFSVEAVALLEELPVDAYKIASGQVTNLPMLEAIHRTGRHVYLSSGMTNVSELRLALDVLSAMPKTCEVTGEELNEPDLVTLLACTSSYPCPPEHVGLNMVQEFRRLRRNTSDGGVSFPAVGLSDHTLGMAASLAAIALGATVIERHVCFDRRGYGTDCAHSLTLDEFAAFVKEVRALDVMLANPVDKDSLARSPEILRMREAFLERPDAT